MSDIKWLSVWCRAYEVDFGDLIADFSLEVADNKVEVEGDSKRGKLIGNLTNYAHAIAGQVYAVDERTLRIEGFEFDGRAPDAFFIAGAKGSKPEPSKGFILPHPFDGKYYDYADNTSPHLEGKMEGVSFPVLQQIEDCSQNYLFI